MTDRETMRKEVERQGLKIAHDPDAQQIVESSFAHIVDTLHDALEDCPICAVYTYRKADQDDGSPFRQADGVCFVHRAKDGGSILYSVAIASETILQGRGYLEFVLLHELSHALTEPVQDHGDVLPHDAVFEAELDQLLTVYEARTGEAVEAND